ncbi:MAG: hypothetical protein U0P47_10710 [Acidimicrobiales bacterium]
MSKDHLVVDGSNIATEGRTAPSLAQLNDAVTDFLKDHSFANVVVIVDATFPNRIDASERAEYEEAILAGELLTPPAGAVGRGDALVLQIAERTGATILSNDSFQEFHASNPWLFEEDRLWGGKPVPGVGWVFVPRVPVKGPTSRRSYRDAKKKAEPTAASARTAVKDNAAGKDSAAGSATATTSRRRSRRKPGTEPSTPVRSESRTSPRSADAAAGSSTAPGRRRGGGDPINTLRCSSLS